MRVKSTRRKFIVGGAALGAIGAIGLPGCTDDQKKTLGQATSSATAGGSLRDIGHIVILMQENRSFDHYFGTMSGVRGFSDPDALNGGAVFSQRGYAPAAHGQLRPFRLRQEPPADDGQTIRDIAHTWTIQHQSWGNGTMESFVSAHVAGDGPADGPLTMGYYTRADLPFYYALADAFTVCDSYHCSVLGPTDSNRVMAWSGTIDPDGAAGGPVLVTHGVDRLSDYGKLRWETMPERLLQAGVSWKVYNDGEGLLAFNPLPYFKPYIHLDSAKGLELTQRALTPTYPHGFVSDVKSGKLPEVSWIVPPPAQCEHPASPPQNGEALVSQVLATLTSNPDVWARTVLLVIYDENGGFFDHVPPPVPPAGTDGEYLTMSPLPAEAGGFAGPVGLGFRTPCLVISPFTAGGYTYSGVLDHTSVLRLIEARFGVQAPNISSWRRSVTGDFTGVLQLSRAPDKTVPSLPAPAVLGNSQDIAKAVLDALSGKPATEGNTYPIPPANPMPAQDTSPARPKIG